MNEDPETVSGLALREATADDVAALADLHGRVAAALTARHRRGPWSYASKEAAVRRAIVESRVWVGLFAGRLAGTFSLQRRKPWAIDPAYFTDVARPIHLKEMAVEPELQRRGIGRALLAQAERSARELGAGAIRLDAWDAPAGAGGFYSRCGYAARGGKVYRGNPLLYFERLLEVAPETGGGGRDEVATRCRRATGSFGIRDGLVDAGATWVDEPAFRYGAPVWGRVVEDVPGFRRELVTSIVGI